MMAEPLEVPPMSAAEFTILAKSLMLSKGSPLEALTIAEASSNRVAQILKAAVTRVCCPILNGRAI